MRAPFLAAGLGLLVAVSPAVAQIQRNPTGVNVNSVGPTTVFITYGNLAGYVPTEAVWCGALVPASPSLGDRCDPATIFGALPGRLDQSRFSGQDGFSDIMSIPESVARRAWQAAAAGAESSFFYVRRFVDPTGASPDQYVAVTCRLAGGGARTPLALLDVELRFTGDEAVPSVSFGSTPPSFAARIAYNGTGRLVGRWEVVYPGQDPPAAEDLLTEATLPAELRGTQRRYAEIERFNLFLPPVGEVTLPGPTADRLPSNVVGQYQILLRIEASDDKEGDVDLGAVGVGTGVVSTGAVAGFGMPVLRYFVGAGGASPVVSARLAPVMPADGEVVSSGTAVAFEWARIAAAALYRLEVRDPSGQAVLDAVLQSGNAAYVAPPFLSADRAGQTLEWRILALDADGDAIESTPWRSLPIGP